MISSNDNTVLQHSIRIVATGGECTGKTTLIAQLAAFFKAPYSAEAAREYADKLGRIVQYDDVEAIAQEQIANEDKLLPCDSSVIFLDTDLYSTLVYSYFYFERCPVWIEPLCNARRADLYLLCDADLTWVEERFQRGSEDPSRRQTIHDLFAEILRRSGCNIVNISGLGDTRLDQAIQAVNEKIGVMDK